MAGPGADRRIDVRKTYKLYIGGAFPRSEIGPHVRRHAPRTATPLANACRASRKDLRDAVRAARKAFEPWAARDGDEPRPGPLPRRRAHGGPARPVRRRGRGGRGPARRQGRATPSTGRSIAGSGTPAGPTRSARSSARRTRSRRRTSTSRSPSRPASSGSSRRSRRRCSASSRRLAPPLVARQRRRRPRLETRPLPAVTLTEVLATSDVPGGVVNLLTGLKYGARPGPRRPRRRRRDRRLGRPGRPADRGRAARRRRHQADRPPPGRGHRRQVRLARRPRRRAPRVDRRLPRDEDGLAPDRRLTPVRAPARRARRRAARQPARSAARQARRLRPCRPGGASFPEAHDAERVRSGGSGRHECAIVQY